VALTSTQDAIAKGNGVSATPTGASGCTLPINTGLINVDVSCGTASAATDASGNPTATGSGDVAGVSVNLSLSSVLGQLLGGLPSAGSLCASAPAASTSAGSGSGALDATLSGLLSTVNKILPTQLNPTSVAGGTDAAGACSIIGGLLTQLGGTSGVGALVTGLLNTVLGLTGGNAATVSPLSITVGGSTSSVSTSNGVVTDSVVQQPVDINLFGFADLKVAPTTASVALNLSTGQVTPACNAGLVSYSTGGGLPNFINIPAINGLVDQLLTILGSVSKTLETTLDNLLGDLINYTPGAPNLFTCKTTGPGTTASASVGILNLGILDNLLGTGIDGVDVSAGDVSVSGSATTATPAVTTAAATPAPPAINPAPAAATAVPNVTTVHTGEFWSGSLPIILLTGMGLAGVMLIGRRRIFSVARSMNSIARRRGGQ